MGHSEIDESDTRYTRVSPGMIIQDITLIEQLECGDFALLGSVGFRASGAGGSEWSERNAGSGIRSDRKLSALGSKSLPVTS